MAHPSPLEFFAAFYPERLTAGRLVLYTTTVRRGNDASHWCYNLLQADRLCAEYRQTRRVRFGVALQSSQRALAIARQRRRRAKECNVRGCDASVTALPALWTEIPYRTEEERPAPNSGHPAAAVSASSRPSRRQALDLLTAIPQRPSIVISTGDALCAFWRFDEPWVFDLDDKSTDRADAKALLIRLQWAIQQSAAEHGWRTQTDGDLAASFPVPKSLVETGASGTRAVLESFPLVSSDGRYSRGDFESLPVPPADTMPSWRVVLDRLSRLARPEGRIYDVRPIAEGCAVVRHGLAADQDLSNAEHDRLLELLSWCDPAVAVPLIHEVCRNHPGYDRYAVDRQIAALQRAPGSPITCRRLTEPPGVAESHCLKCPHFGQISSPVQLDRTAPTTIATKKAGTATSDVTEAGGSVAPPTGDSSNRRRISITCRQHEVNDQALAALAERAQLFEQAGRLVELVHGSGSIAVVRPVPESRLQELLSRHCHFVVEVDGSSDRYRDAPPPRWTTRALLARGDWPELPRLDDPLTVSADPDRFPNPPTRPHPSAQPKEEVCHA